MGFRVGDKVKVTENFLLRLPFLKDEVKGGGTIITMFEDEAEIKFCSGYTPHIYLRSLELKLVKNQQLLFPFMNEVT